MSTDEPRTRPVDPPPLTLLPPTQQGSATALMQILLPIAKRVVQKTQNPAAKTKPQ